ncbi:uncharacterized protein LOC18426468 isoform X2 [Amborella trichopoda]|nr:uncharacterized protein LOC18426468 isoform X2 [Amborella trichopoda]XP_020518139.1 uncharacterized protein LOC18426468 isoform X2 [Amborella trichopoda]XP_020518140.1 uncharacterized protein LOC18426468 isoform X2 [Amborella trichopoda]XP_020518141.1 uncharacterized protein LOC18426468 isoform X2 [Amborella trichopoda]XP_020518142.1 uncharacterized protein LOC18426468 isoform X2 [Amborella trichopoda]|eukprot:XP_020518138.1 uncharacterized protein LOC18426468 isoform X2 [Amborella trichopoda]
MIQHLHNVQGAFSFHNSSSIQGCHHQCQLSIPSHLFLHQGLDVSTERQGLKGRTRSSLLRLKVRYRHMLTEPIKNTSVDYEVELCNGAEKDIILPVQCLRNYPKEDLFGKIVMVRFDSTVLFKEGQMLELKSVHRAFASIKYLCNAGAKVVIVTDWGEPNGSTRLPTQSVADYLSKFLQVKVLAADGIYGRVQSKQQKLETADILLLENLSVYKEEVANCPIFSEKLSSGIDIFVNDAFSDSHRILASTVGVVRFAHASVAGFHFEEELLRLTKALEIIKRPYIAVIGGGNLMDKSSALCHLASHCDGLVFVGTMAFQFMHALGLPVSSGLLEVGAAAEALKLINLAKERNIPILIPRDFWCMNSENPKLLNVFPAHDLLDGWKPIDLGPKSLTDISSLLSESKKVLWIGPVKLGTSQEKNGASRLVFTLGQACANGCLLTVVGRAACKAIKEVETSQSMQYCFKSAAVVWKILKGQSLPGVAALDQAYPYVLNWSSIYDDPSGPLIVDIGSGNGLFLLRMARTWSSLNFLGLEINKKLVHRCLESVQKFGLRNGHFISTNATTTFRSIVSSYPGFLLLVSVQIQISTKVTIGGECCKGHSSRQSLTCFLGKERILWCPLFRSGIISCLHMKVFLQSDIKSVATRMKQQFIRYGRGKLLVDVDGIGVEYDGEGWLKHNPFSVQSDWEQHVIDRGDPMYRVMLAKADGN